jgi:hypothetical protein
MCRASYLVSNAGDAVKCYGRALRFPQDRKLYLAEMKLALGDVIMQCRLIEEENEYEHKEIDEFVKEYKAAFASDNIIDKFEFLKKGDITKYYYGGNYNRENNGELQKSCMRADYCAPYFKIYKTIKSYKHVRDGKPYKRRTVSVYMEKKRIE